MRRWRRTVPAALLVALLTACTVPPLDPTSDPELELPPAPPPARTSWALSHRVIESYGLQITGHNIGHYEEATYLSVGRDANGFDIPCYVTVSVPGQGGGPESMIGEKVPTHVQGRPGFRNGAGAEAAYAMWQHAGESWTMVHCGLDHQRFVDVVVNALQFRPSSIFLPFGLVALPEGYGLSNISQDLSLGRTEVYVGAVDPAFGPAEPELVISYETGTDPSTAHAAAPSPSTAGRDAERGADESGNLRSGTAALCVRLSVRRRHRTVSEPVRRDPHAARDRREPALREGPRRPVDVVPRRAGLWLT